MCFVPLLKKIKQVNIADEMVRETRRVWVDCSSVQKN